MMFCKFRLLFFVCFFQTLICSAQSVNQNLPELVLDKKIEGAIVKGAPQIYRLHLESNQFAALVLDKKGVNAAVSIEDAQSGKQLLDNKIDADDFGLKHIYVRSNAAPLDLFVRVGAPDENKTASGAFAITLKALKTINESDKKRIAAQKAFTEAESLSLKEDSESESKAQVSAETAVKLAQETGDETLAGESMILLQKIFNQRGEHKKAIELGKNAIELFAGQKSFYGLGKAKYYTGYALLNSGEIKQALQILSEALDNQQKIGDRRSEAFTSIGLGFAYNQLSDSAKAAEMAMEAYRAAKEVGDKEAQIQALIISSGAYYTQSEFNKALESLNQALPLAQETNSSIIVNIYNEIAKNSASLGQRQKSLDYSLKTLEAARKWGFTKFNEATALANIAKEYTALGEFDRAYDYHSQAAKLFDEVGSKQAIISSLAAKGAIYFAAKDFQKSKQSFIAALKYAEENDFPIEAGTTSANLALSEMRLNETQAAIAHFRQSIELRRGAKNKRLEAISLSALAEAHIELGQNAEVAETAAQALVLARAAGDSTTESDALYSLSIAARAQGDFPGALEKIRQSLEIVESVRSDIVNQSNRTAFFARVRKKYDLYINLLIELEKKSANREYGAQAFAVSENARARSLLDLLAESNIDVSSGISSDLKSREQQNVAKISALQTQLLRLKSVTAPDEKSLARIQEQITAADNEREELESEIRRTNPRYAALKYPTTLDLKQTQNLLDDKTVLLEYQVGKPASYLFAVTKNDLQIVPLPDEQKLRESVELLHRSVSQPSRAGLATYILKARELCKTLLAPLGETLKNKNKLIISGDGALNYLPFEVLLTSDADAALNKLPYLVRSYEISYTPSASVLANLNNAENAVVKPDKTFLAFAAPDYGIKSPTPNSVVATRSVFGENRAWNLSDLKNAGLEAARIAKLFPAGQAEVFTGAQATEERVKSIDLLNHYRYLHFAVHGLMDEEQPQFSSLVLTLPKTEIQSANENPKSQIPNLKSEEDGLLQTPEIFNLKLRADLVTLSACETGRGKQMRGEGIVGLTRAFFYAGTPSVLVSLWKVDDASTAELMTNFYDSLRQTNGREKAAALRQAQLKMIAGNRYAHPYYWAPFVLQGKSNSAGEISSPAGQ